MYNFTEIVQESAKILQRSGDADYLTKVKTWVNLGHKFAAELYDFWPELQSEPFSITSVDGQEKYYLPSDFDKAFRLYDTYNNRPIKPVTREEYYDSNISNIADAIEGVPNKYMLYGVSAVARNITSGITLQAKSSSTDDNDAVIVRVEGWLDSSKTILGYENITIDTAAPTTYTTASSPTTFYGITRVTKSMDTSGYVTLADNSSNVLSTIAPNDRESRYPVLYFGLIPDASTYTYQLLYKKKIKRLVNDYDYPFADITDYLVLNAVGYGLHEEKESEGRANTMWSKANDLLTNIIANKNAKFGTDFQHKFITTGAQTHRQ